MSDEIPAAMRPSTELDAEACTRQRIWEEIGMPMSPMFLTQHEMDNTYRGRISCINRTVLEEAQRSLKFVGCPKCVVERDYGEITVTRFHTRVMDDVMTVFKAMARNFCYNCGYEEYWPLQRDPRARPDDSEKHIQDLLRLQQQALGGQNIAANPYMQGVGGMMMTPSERQALMREYQRRAAQNASPPLRTPGMAGTKYESNAGWLESAMKKWMP